MVFHVNEKLMEKESLVPIGTKKLKKVRSFKYLGYTITNSANTSQSLYTRIGAAFQKLEELKHVAYQQAQPPSNYTSNCMYKITIAVQCSSLGAFRRGTEKIRSRDAWLPKKMVRGSYRLPEDGCGFGFAIPSRVSLSVLCQTFSEL